MPPVNPIPNFDQRGLLPAGDYHVTFDQIRHSHLVQGDGSSATWDTTWRRSLVDHCEIMVRQLWAAGVTAIVLDGSFVEAKDRPSDIDGYFECDVNGLAILVARLNAGDPEQIWDWNPNRRTLDVATGKRQLPMWHRHHVELYPHVGQPSGIPNRHGHPQLFPAAFRQQRGTYEPKGVLVVVQPQGGVQ
ncbi:DUF6932 family protein [Deinococcus sp. PEB2-63]